MLTTKTAEHIQEQKATSPNTLRVGVIGYGYWGPNLARNISEVNGAELIQVVDQDPKRQTLAKKRFPHIQTASGIESLIHNSKIDAVFITTPISTHYEIAKAALEAGKHVLVAKPLAASSKEADELVRLADKHKRVLMVDHTFIYTRAVQKIKEIVKRGELGDIYYFDSVRVNLGLFQQDLNVVWDLAPHDLSILMYVLEKEPLSLIATGARHSHSQIENMAYISMELARTIMAHLHVNWLAPVKVRLTMICGRKKMLIYDDLEADEKIKVYDRGIEVSKNNKEGLYKTLIEYRTGDMYAPNIEKVEALKLECEHFVECVQEGRRPITDGHTSLKVVRIL
ncbi:MAG: Gfo/Idh/MocA family oxidoreductase, partial [Candidatus Omnitrophica bacterium]|nr:Gfo/Idh/MocA family oxidoreductase [Candidatus Omnitrophota bacterium]